MNQTVTYLQELTAIPSPTGLHGRSQTIWSKPLKALGMK